MTSRLFTRMGLLVGRLILAAIFLAAGFAKLGFFSWSPGAGVQFDAHPQIGVQLAFFAAQVDSYQILPPWAVIRVAHWLPWLELALGAWLISGWKLRWPSLVSTVLLGAFFTVVMRTYALGLEINCGCFGPNEKLDRMTLVRDGSLLALSLAVTIGAFLLRPGKASGEGPVAAAR